MSAATNSKSNVPGIPWWGVLLGGIAAIIVGLLLLLYPAAATLAIVQFMGIYWLFTGLMSIVMLFIDRSKWGWKLISGLLGITAGLIVLAYPLISAFAVPTIIIIVVSIESILMGIVALIQAFQGGGWGIGVLGALAILVGLVLLFNPFLAALGLPFVVGVLAVGLGIVALFASFQVRGLQKASAEAAARQPASIAQPVIETRAAEPIAAVPSGTAATTSVAAGAVAASVVADEMPAPEAIEEEQEVSFADAGAAESGVVASERSEMVEDAGGVVAFSEPDAPEEMAKFKEELTYVEGIGPVYAEKLHTAGMVTIADLLHRGATRKGRQEISESSGISSALVLKWVNHADLYRIKGVGSEYADLLEAAGVDTVVELGMRNPENLLVKMTAVNEAKNLVLKLPVLSQVQDWVDQAKLLPRVVQY